LTPGSGGGVLFGKKEKLANAIKEERHGQQMLHFFIEYCSEKPA
jgi:hypothetical protein